MWDAAQGYCDPDGRFKADVLAMFRQAGVKAMDTLFLFTDAQVLNERFLVYINDLLASGVI